MTAGFAISEPVRSVDAIFDRTEGLVRCPECGSSTFDYQENVIEWRRFGDQDEEAQTVTVVWDMGDHSDGDGDPGLICAHCGVAINLPEEWEVDYA